MKRQKKPSKLDCIAEAVAQDHAHASTDDLARKRKVYACLANTIEDEIAELQARLARARGQRAVVEAKLQGLTNVVRKR